MVSLYFSITNGIKFKTVKNRLDHVCYRKGICCENVIDMKKEIVQDSLLRMDTLKQDYIQLLQEMNSHSRVNTHMAS